MDNIKLLEWKDEYSVNVKEIDEQHKILFKIINELITEISAVPNQDNVKKIIMEIAKYKAEHFETEEKYFKLFNYEDSESHIKKHQEFTQKVHEIQEEHKEDTIGLAFALIDYLENWLITHLLETDHKYIQCFNSHGLH